MVKDFHKWLNDQDAGHIISVQGNHELWVEKNFLEAKKIAEKACPAVHFIEEGLIEIEGVKIWCSSWTPWFHSWAYNAARGEQIKRHWDLIPEDTNVLVTHGPPYEILDEVLRIDGSSSGRFVGCEELLKRVKQIKPDIHIFGHIHCGYGEKHIDGTSFYNASICDEMYCASNAPHVIELERP